MSNIQTKSKTDVLINNGFIFLGLGILVCGIILGLSYELDEQVQNAERELKQTEYAGLVLMGENLMVAGYYTMIIDGVLLSLLGYSLKRLLK